jgi:hypothetical protein
MGTPSRKTEILSGWRGLVRQTSYGTRVHPRVPKGQGHVARGRSGQCCTKSISRVACSSEQPTERYRSSIAAFHYAEKACQLKEDSIGRPKDRRQHLLQLTALSPLMKEQLLKFRTNLVLGLPAAFGLGISSPAVLGARKRQRSQSMGCDPAVGQRHGNGGSIEEPSRNP